VAHTPAIGELGGGGLQPFFLLPLPARNSAIANSIYVVAS